MQVEIEHLDVASVVKISFLIYAVIGLVLGVVYVFVALVLGGILGDEVLGGGAVGLAATGLGLLLVPVLALVYGLIGAVGGLVFAVVYNALARSIGGVKVALKGEAGQGTAPVTHRPAPQGLGGFEGQTEVRL